MHRDGVAGPRPNEQLPVKHPMHRNANHVVIAADGSENSRRAVAYVGRLLGGLDGFKTTVLHVIHAPGEDFFPSAQERERWVQLGRNKVNRWLADYRQMLISDGFQPDAVAVVTVERDGPSLAWLILDETTALAAGTLVVGRQGLSLKEEVLFGSVSREIVSQARNCTVWVVQ